jgi:hypothetical protein
MSSFTTAPPVQFMAVGQNSFAGPLILLNQEPHVSVDGMLTHDSFILLPRNSRASSNTPPQPLLQVPLTSISTVRSTPSCPNSFSVTLDSAQSCHLQSPSKKEMNRWLFEFQRSLSHLLKKVRICLSNEMLISAHGSSCALTAQPCLFLLARFTRRTCFARRSAFLMSGQLQRLPRLLLGPIFVALLQPRRLPPSKHRISQLESTQPPYPSPCRLTPGLPSFGSGSSSSRQHVPLPRASMV